MMLPAADLAILLTIHFFSFLLLFILLRYRRLKIIPLILLLYYLISYFFMFRVEGYLYRRTFADEYPPGTFLLVYHLVYYWSRFVLSVIPFAFVITALYISFPNLFQRGQSEVIDGTERLRAYVEKILDSGEFLTALRSTLPKGAADGEHGLDYVPFMLHAIDERRRRFTKSARLFLAATIAFAVIFSGIVMYFGYILASEEATGTARTLRELRGETSNISTRLDDIIVSYNDPKFRALFEPPLAQLMPLIPESARPYKESLEQALKAAKDSNDVTGLMPLLKDFEQKANFGSDSAESVRLTAKVISERASQYESTLQGTAQRLKSETDSIKQLVVRANDDLSKPENRTSEIVRRLAIGLVVATFFLAILRYLTGLYRNHYQQMLKAEADDLAVRRFYIAYKSTANNEDQRKAVLTTFISSKDGVESGDGKESSEGVTKADIDILKEVVSALSKKI